MDGDGYITQMRVKDPAGKYRVHPLDPRVLIPIKPELNEPGEYSLYVEGIDNDEDEKFNEDGPGGVDFNRNWTWNYPAYSVGAGPNAVSEPETRAVADFLFDHPEIALVYTLGPQDNLAEPWKEGGASSKAGEIKSSVLPGDAPLLNYISEEYKKTFETKGAPKGEAGDGSFGYWAYFHYGRWSLMAQPWWVPEEKKPEEKEEKPAEAPAAADADAGAPVIENAVDPAASGPEKPVWDEKDERGQADIRKLKWLEEQGRAGFAPWTTVGHQDFPGQQVEVGGFLPEAFHLPEEVLTLTAAKQLRVPRHGRQPVAATADRQHQDRVARGRRLPCRGAGRQHGLPAHPVRDGQHECVYADADGDPDPA